MTNVIEALGGKLESITINDLPEHTFFATLNVKDSHGKVMKIDSRPSDADRGDGQQRSDLRQGRMLDAAQNGR